MNNRASEGAGETGDAQLGEVVMYDGCLDVRLAGDTVWLHQAQIAKLYGTQIPAISKHLSNMLKSKELERSSVVSKMENTAIDGKTYQTFYYNLDAIIAVGYRVNSRRATRFRIWATSLLRQHLISGYTINNKVLQRTQARYQDLRRAIDLISQVSSARDIPLEARGIARSIDEYSRALDLLGDYDHGCVEMPIGTIRPAYELSYDESLEIIRVVRSRVGDQP